MADDQPTYRIKDWNIHFENHQSRGLNHPRWVPFPNKHDGKSYKRIMRLPNGIAIFGAWILIVEVASKMPVRGLLVKDGQSLTAEDLADKTEAPQSIFEEALKVLSDPKIGWISTESCTGNPQAVENSLNPSDCGTCKTALEGKGRERNRNEKNGKAATPRQEKPRKTTPELEPPFTGEAFIQSLATYKASRTRALKTESELLLYDDLREWGESESVIALTGAAKAGHLQVLHPDKYRHNGNGKGFQAHRNGGPGSLGSVGSEIDDSIWDRAKHA